MRKSAIAVVLVSASLLWSGTQALAMPATREKVYFAFIKSRVNAHHGIALKYSAAGLPRGSALYLQRQAGTAHAWQQVRRLRGLSGRVIAPGVPLGQYAYRVEAKRGRRSLKASRVRKLYSYGSVSIGTLCSNSKVVDNAGNGCPYSGSTQVGSHIFQYKILVNNNGSSVYPNFYQLIQFPATTCRSISITFGMPADSSQSGDTAYIETVEQTKDPAVASAGFGSLATFRAQLDGHPWFLENAATSTNDGIAINATASCYTRSGY